MFDSVIAFVVYLHHTHPQVPFFRDRSAWSPTIGQLACSTVIRSNRLVEAFTLNIFIPSHHVDGRIRFYLFKQAYDDLAACYGGHVREYRLKWTAVRLTERRLVSY